MGSHATISEPALHRLIDHMQGVMRMHKQIAATAIHDPAISLTTH